VAFVLRRLAASVPTLLGISLVAFLLIHLVPGDPAQAMLFGSDPTPAQLAGLRAQLGLTHSLWSQYAGFLGQLFHGDLGTSYVTQTSVAHELLSRVPSTLTLAGAALLVAVLVGVPLGFVAGVRPDSAVDRIARAISFLGVAIPYFWLALVMVLVLSTSLHLLPAIDDGTPQALLIPAVSLGWGYAAILTRLIRGRVIEEYHADYVKAARARGCAEWRVLLRHAARNSVIPAVTTLGLQFGNILTGAAVTEVIFGRPGLGSYLAGSITAKNIPVVQGAVVVIGIGYVLINLLVDIVIGLIDPRARLTTASA
jgi:peptide/nickel transport system permease protein